MTKENFIKQEWHKINSSINVSKCNSKGELFYKNIPSNSLREKILSGNLIPKCFNYYLPKSLEGIENNNGWIKIESENDLPKENGKQYQVVMKKDKSIHIGFYFEQTHKSQWIENISHYLEIKTPKPPIY